MSIYWARAALGAFFALTVTVGVARAETVAKPADGNSAKATETKLWDLVKSGKGIVLMRHALAPGTGDPASFKLGDCKTQRNLSDEGREQARKIGARFKAAGIEKARVYTSAWCRTRETARLLDLGEPRTFPPLNSFFQRPKAKPFQTKKLEAFVLSAADPSVKVMVTHQVNITALTGKYPKSGQMFVVQRTKDRKIKVVGSL